MSEVLTCRALVVRCIDFRFVTKQRRFLVESGYRDDYDSLAVPGASKNLSKIEDTIALSMKLHRPEEIFIFDHEDCGAYGEDNSFETHKRNLQKAKTFLKEKYPKVKVKTYMSKFKGIEEVV